MSAFLLASRIRVQYYLGFHTALEYYGCANSFFNETYIAVRAKDRFDPFRYSRYWFRPVFVKDVLSHIDERNYQENTIRVSSKERTFIECIERIHYAGGWEECIKSLEDLGGLDTEKLSALLVKQGNNSTLRRAGYILELLRTRSPFYEHIPDQLLQDLEKRVSGPP